MTDEEIIIALQENTRRIEGLKGLHVAVITKTIEDYEDAEVDEHFINAQKVQLQKVNALIKDLEGRNRRLLKRLGLPLTEN
ncbi:MAG: hypothetical protein GXY34_05435 [Syntrophomonadaceae bacterium]|nr:hypothetical protein [Syntrophomonadaceae bacterium]